MVRHSFAPLVVLALFILQAQCTPVRFFQKRGICATEDPDSSFLSALDLVQVDETRPSAGSEARQGPIEIDTWFHIVTSRAEADQVTTDMINSQVGPRTRAC